MRERRKVVKVEVMWRSWPGVVEPVVKSKRIEAGVPKTPECPDQETEGNAAANAAPGTVPASPARAPAAAVPQSQPPAAASRHFLERWRTNRPWLVYSAEENVMFCHACRA